MIRYDEQNISRLIWEWREYKLYYLTLMATKNISRLLNTSFEYKCLHPHKVRDVRVVKAMNCSVSESNH